MTAAAGPREPGLLGLDGSHIRHIGAILVLLDQRLDEMERWASWPLPSGPLYRWHRNLTPAALLRVQEEVARAREELRSIARRLNLLPHVKTAASSIQTGATFSLIDLEELEPSRIKAYGALSEEQGRELAALWNPLREPLEIIRGQCSDLLEGGSDP
jgi:hypothetical protein